MAQRRKELEKKAAELEAEKSRITQLKREKEVEFNDLKIHNETITADIDRLAREITERKQEIEEKELAVKNQENMIAETRAKIEKLKKKKRFIWCG